MSVVHDYSATGVRDLAAIESSSFYPLAKRAAGPPDGKWAGGLILSARIVLDLVGIAGWYRASGAPP